MFHFQVFFNTTQLVQLNLSPVVTVTSFEISNGEFVLQYLVFCHMLLKINMLDIFYS